MKKLETVSRTLTSLLAKYQTGSNAPTGKAYQVSASVVDSHRKSINELISVTDQIELESLTQPAELEGHNWRAVTGTLSAAQLVDLHTRYKDDLFNANIRDYLGSRETDRNINNQMRKTAADEPGNFWIFNNGITVLTNELVVSGTRLRLLGASIINGAQTTGSLSSAASGTSVAEAKVPFRAIECRDPALVARIIRYNNLQNPVTEWERRSIDPLQLRLQESFGKVGFTYQLRRGEARRKSTDIHLERLGPYLTAFYGSPIAATRKSDVFDDERRYREAFLEGASPGHLLFVYRLGEAIAAAKARLRARVEAGGADGESAELTYRYFRFGTFSHILLWSASRILGIWLQSRDPDFVHRVTLKSDPENHLVEWDALLLMFVEETVLPAVRAHLEKLTFTDALLKLKSVDGASDIAASARALIEQVNGMKADTYSQVTSELDLA